MASQTTDSMFCCTKNILFRPPLPTFSPLSSRTPFLHAATVSRATAVDCGMLAALEAKEGPPKDYMAEEAVQKKQTRRLAECSFKTKLETGKFRAGCLSEKVKHETACQEGRKQGRGWRTHLSPALVILPLTIVRSVSTPEGGAQICAESAERG